MNTITFMLDRDAANYWYWENKRPPQVYHVSEALNAAQEELYKFCRENDIRIRRKNSGIGGTHVSWWHVNDTDYNLLKLTYGDMLRTLTKPIYPIPDKDTTT